MHELITVNLRSVNRYLPLALTLKRKRQRYDPKTTYLCRNPLPYPNCNELPLVVEAVNHLKVRSCLIDGEAVCCDDRALTIFKVLCSPRYQPASHEVNVAFAARL